MNRSALIAAACIALPLLARADAGSAPGLPLPQDVMRALREQGACIDEREAARAAVEGILRHVDPQARLLGDGEQMPAAATGAVFVARWPANIVYARLTHADREAADSVVRAVCGGERGVAGGVILDLRCASGTDLHVVRDLASLFSVPGTGLFARVTADGRTLAEYAASTQACACACPVMILTAPGTRGTAEALTAVLKECGRAMTIGTRTAGDDGVRERVALGGGIDAYVATSRIVPASGHRYNDGVPADIEAGGGRSASQTEGRATGLPPATARDTAALLKALEADPALRRAVDVLLGLKAVDVEAMNRVDEILEPEAVPATDDAAPAGVPDAE